MQAQKKNLFKKQRRCINHGFKLSLHGCLSWVPLDIQGYLETLHSYRSSRDPQKKTLLMAKKIYEPPNVKIAEL